MATRKQQKKGISVCRSSGKIVSFQKNYKKIPKNHHFQTYRLVISKWQEA
jgi:hypothetical protein